MGLTQVRKGGIHLTDDGSIHDTHEKDVVQFTPNDIRALSWLQMFIARTEQQIELRCRKCDHSITGKNNDSSTVVSMSCRCTEWRLSR